MPILPGTIITHLHPALVRPDELPGAIAIIIDQLRASTTICTALHAGAARVIPCPEPDDARRFRASLPPGSCLTGGERHGLLIPGFDLDNSPASYTPERVRAKSIAFTTTNGTAAALLAAPAALVFVGCLANLSALVARIGVDPRPVHLLCAGTRARVTEEDALVAGAIAERLAALGRPTNSPDPREDDDSTRIALTLWRSIDPTPSALSHALRASRGGRNLTRAGLGADIDRCSTIDTLPVVPTFDPAAREFRLA